MENLACNSPSPCDPHAPLPLQYYSSKIQDDSDTFHFYPETSNISGPDSVFLLQINMQAIDPSLLSTSLSFSLQPAGNFSFASVTGEEAVQDVIYFPPSYIQALLEFYNLSLADPNVPVEPSVIFFVTSYGVNEVPSDQLAPQFVQTYPLSAVKALTQYPLDVYEWKLFIRVYLRLVGVADRAEQTAYTILPLTV